MRLYNMVTKQFEDTEEILPHHLVIFDNDKEKDDYLLMYPHRDGMYAIIKTIDIVPGGLKKATVAKAALYPTEFIFRSEWLTPEEVIETFLDKLEARIALEKDKDGKG